MQIERTVGALVGIEKACRDFRGLLKSQLNYDTADGFDLMLERKKSDGLNLAEATPELRFTIRKNSNFVLSC